jgi:c-di-GMP-binding flagellar brake protein YcgR
MEERRHFVRLDTRIEVTYTKLPQANLQAVVTKNISAGGICFFANEELPEGTTIRAAMSLPGRPHPILFTARVVWSEAYEVIGKEERRRAIEIGIEFINIAPSDKEVVMRHVILSFLPISREGIKPSAT